MSNQVSPIRGVSAGSFRELSIKTWSGHSDYFWVEWRHLWTAREGSLSLSTKRTCFERKTPCGAQVETAPFVTPETFSPARRRWFLFRASLVDKIQGSEVFQLKLGPSDFVGCLAAFLYVYSEYFYHLWPRAEHATDGSSLKVLWRDHPVHFTAPV